MDKAIQHLYRCCILRMEQYPAEPINLGPNCTLFLGILNPIIPYPACSIHRHEILLEEQLKLLPSQGTSVALVVTICHHIAAYSSNHSRADMVYYCWLVIQASEKYSLQLYKKALAMLDLHWYPQST